MGITDQDFSEGWGLLQITKQRWQLTDDGSAFKTDSSILQPVLYRGDKAMLKISLSAEEQRGSLLMVCWNGNGAAKIFEQHENALLMEGAAGKESLLQLVRSGYEDDANKIICSVAARLHAVGQQCAGNLVPLKEWFHALEPAAGRYGGILPGCSKTANLLLNNPLNEVVLHGDIHYQNILDTGSRGWIAIDPKGLTGERGFDFANIFCNPDIETAASRQRIARQVKLISGEANLDGRRLLNWIIAWAGLSATWMLNDGMDASLPLTVATMASGELINF